MSDGNFTCIVPLNYKEEWLIQRDKINALEKENETLRNTILGLCKSLFGKEGADNE